jgi:hypothetical protein
MNAGANISDGLLHGARVELILVAHLGVAKKTRTTALFSSRLWSLQRCLLFKLAATACSTMHFDLAVFV